ncbi:methyltransferase domain-containing protein [Kushneria phosphatilytica]|uniref:tRNA 5-carboxymethoxyuridine methyltransferase n=1 Tax=Kushneria phosphatilytica TaxID=657387 RepID=A0A1S1NUW3_9GAMM|nr:methyltransferase domain-containing protein [Kushneria phosphatilytica]OHV09997.1 SAM-dependent methyltransferase [Kushneria phosphatilytica]QEL11680.1 methyltransferase domain-containing protein [Kushneria phosphatilytica]
MSESPLGDRHFNGMVEKFAQSMYSASRGQLRLALLQETLQRELPLHDQPILDVGGGLGHMAQWAAERGHSVTLLEPAEDMLAAARERLGGLKIDYHAVDLQGYQAPHPWPLVFCHAVLEWLAAPEAAIPRLAELVAPGGWVSLMVFNADALRLSNIVKGNLDRVLADRLAGMGKGKRLTPISPLTHEQIMRWVQAAGLEVRGVTGIRVFHDYLRERHPDAATLDKLFELERRFCRCEPYWRLGRYLHYTLHRPDHSADASF